MISEPKVRHPRRALLYRQRRSILTLDGQRWCSRCGEVKSETDFYTIGGAISLKTGKARPNGECKLCSVRSGVEWRQRMPERSAAFAKKHYAKLRREVLMHYAGGVEPYCACCGESRGPFLTLDHLNNDGAAHRRTLGQSHGSGSGGPVAVYRDLKRRGFPPGHAVSCINCNATRGWSGECPHQTQRRAIVQYGAFA
mgnify:FL=1